MPLTAGRCLSDEYTPGRWVSVGGAEAPGPRGTQRGQAMIEAIALLVLALVVLGVLLLVAVVGHGLWVAAMALLRLVRPRSEAEALREDRAVVRRYLDRLVRLGRLDRDTADRVLRGGSAPAAARAAAPQTSVPRRSPAPSTSQGSRSAADPAGGDAAAPEVSSPAGGAAVPVPPGSGAPPAAASVSSSALPPATAVGTAASASRRGAGGIHA